MSATELEQRSDDELRALAEAPARAAAELARRQRVAAERLETDAPAAAETWAAKAVLAVKKLAGSLDEMLERVRTNPNARDVGAANAIWAKIVAYLELAEVIQKRFPGTVAAMPTVAPPGRRRGFDEVPGLLIAAPQRQLLPIILASDSAELRARIFAYEAHKWLVGRGAALPEELAAVAAAVVPEPDLAERVAFQRAESRRQRAAAFRVGV